MRAHAYARVSSHEQVNGTSLDNQTDSIRAYASMKGLELAGIYIDAGVSGGKPLADRPEGRRLLEALGPEDCVIVCKLDRGFRSASDCLNNVEAWEKRGVALHILNLGGQTIDTSTPTGKFFITVMAAAAELERNLINERCNEGRQARRAEGKRVGEIPFGYELTADGKTLVICSQEQEAIDLVRRLNHQGYSANAIAQELERRGHRTKKGATWTHKQVTRILKRAA